MPIKEVVAQVDAHGIADLGGHCGHSRLKRSGQAQRSSVAESVRQPPLGNGAVAQCAGVSFEPRFEREDGAVSTAQVFISLESEARTLHVPTGKAGLRAAGCSGDMVNANVDDAVHRHTAPVSRALRHAKRRKAPKHGR